MKSYSTSVVGAMTLAARASRKLRSRLRCLLKAAPPQACIPRSVTSSALSAAAALDSSTRSMAFGARSFHGVQRADQVGAGAVGLDPHLREAGAQVRQVGQLAVQMLEALAGQVLRGRLDRRLADADGNRRVPELKDRQHDAEHELEALARLAERAVGRNRAVLQRHGGAALPRSPSESHGPLVASPASLFKQGTAPYRSGRWIGASAWRPHSRPRVLPK